MDQSTRDLIEALQEKLREQDAALQKLSAPPLGYGTVIRVGDHTITLMGKGGVMEIERDKDRIADFGDNVLVNEFNQIVQLAPALPLYGNVVVISRVLDAFSSEIAGEGAARVVLNGKTSPKARDRVLLDASGVIAAILPQEDAERFVASNMVSVPWDSIGGQSEAKAALQEAVALPKLHPEIFAHYGKKFPSGILLSGPPGNGKTMLGKAVATSLNGKGHGSFFSMKGPEALDPFVGEAERKIRNLFIGARAYRDKTGEPAVIFIDEAEALLSRRGSGISSDMERTIVPTFLAEMNGLEESAAIVILATNRPEQLDPAIVRDGRMDRKITVPRPSEKDAEDILGIYLRTVPLAKKETVKAISQDAVIEIYLGDRKIGNKPMKDVVSGALLANLVEQAKAFALHRDLAVGGKPSGVSRADMANAIARAERENQHVTH